MSRFDTIVIILLVAVNFVCFGNIFKNTFIWDDRALIVRDYHLRSTRHLRDIFTRDFFSHSDEEVKYGYYRPLITVSYMSDFYFWGLNPVGFHFTNLLFHIVNCCLIYLLAVRFFPASRYPGVLAAFLFAVHPIHTESVTWIAGRTDVICAFFFLFSFLLYFRPEKYNGRPPRALLLISCLSFALALLSKEAALVLPLILLFGERFYMRKKPKTVLRRTFPYWGILIGYLVWRFLIVRVQSGPKAGQALPVVFLSFFRSFWIYVYKLIWPLNLSVYIQNPYLKTPLRPSILVCVSLTLLLIYFMKKLIRSDRRIIFFIISFLICFLPFSNLIRISAPMDMGFPIAERFLYIPSIFFFLFLSAGYYRIRRFRKILLASGIIISLCWSVLTGLRNKVWKDEEYFFQNAIAETDSPSPYLYANLGQYYAEQGDYEQAIGNLEKAKELDRQGQGFIRPNLLNNLIAAYRLGGKIIEAQEVLADLKMSGYRNAFLEYNSGMLFLARKLLPEAELSLQRALEMNPRFVDARLGLARVYQEGKEYKLAADNYREAISLFPRSAELHNRLGVVYKESGAYDKARRQYDRALQIDPEHAAARANRGVVNALLNNFHAAVADLTIAARKQPELWEARNALGMAYARLGRRELARSKFIEIIKSDPENSQAHLNLGILFYQEDDFLNARRQFQTVLKLDPDNVRARNFLLELKRIESDSRSY